MTPTEITAAEATIEAFFTHYFSRAETIGEDACVNSIGLALQVRGSAHNGFTLKYGVCLDNQYVSERSDPWATSMRAAFDEALHRRGYDVQHRDTKLIGGPSDS